MNVLPKKSSKYFIAFGILFAIFKIFLISGEEIVARYQPLDDLWQITAASYAYWFGGGYNWASNVHLQAYPLWISLVWPTGVPLRLAAEFLFLSCAFYFASSLRTLKFPSWVCLGSFALIVFHPASFQLLNYTLPDTFYAPLFLSCLGSLIYLWSQRNSKTNLRYSVIAGLNFAILWHTRKESILLVFLLLFFLAFLALTQWLDGKSPKDVGRILCRSVAPLVLIIFAVSMVVKTANYAKYGLFVSTEMDSKGYKAAYKALLKVKPQQSTRFIPVTQETRQRIYEISPSFKELQPLYEGAFGHAVAADTRRYMGIEGEIAAGWFYWTLRQAADQKGYHSDAKKAEEFYLKIADEIESAIRDGRIEGRFVLSDFIDPDYRNYLPYLGSSFGAVAKVFHESKEPVRETDSSSQTPDSVRRFFDERANRRSALVNKDLSSMDGWAFIDRNKLGKISMRHAKSDATLSSTESFTPREDLVSGFRPKGLVVDINAAFSLTTKEDISDSYLLIESSDRSLQFRIPFSDFSSNPSGVVKSADGKHVAYYGIDAFSLPKNNQAVPQKLQSLIWKAYTPTLQILEFLSVISLILLICLFRLWKRNWEVYFIITLLFLAISSRTFLFVFLDASSWPGTQPRYLFPAMQIYGVFLFLFTFQGFSLLFAKFKNRNKEVQS